MPIVFNLLYNLEARNFIEKRSSLFRHFGWAIRFDFDNLVVTFE